MVTKRSLQYLADWTSSVLAKIHMVTKPMYATAFLPKGSVLAKIHMVTKQSS